MVLASGAFDGLHAGHVRYLQAARRYGSPLVVAIAPDSYILHSKHRAPYWSQMDRAATVWALDCVERVVLQQSDSVAEIIAFYHPAIFVKGADWKNRLPDDVLAACQAAGTLPQFVDTPGRHVHEAHG